MKRFIGVLAFICGTLTVFGQKAELTTAILNLREVEKLKGPDAVEKCIKAKESIDKSYDKLQNGGKLSSKDKVKMHFHRGVIYMSRTNQQIDANEIGADELAVSRKAMQESFKYVMENDQRKSWKPQLAQRANIDRVGHLNKGVELYQAKDYGQALIRFESASEIWSCIGQTDSLAQFNSGLCYDNLKQYDKAYQSYLNCARMGYQGDKMYQNAIIAKRQADNGEYKPELLEVISEGRKKFPTSQLILVEEVNYHLSSGNNVKAENSLTQAIQSDPSNKSLHFAVGTVYDNLKKYDKAEAAYKKALEIDGSYFEALYNLGALFYNKGADEMNAANEIEDMNAYEKKKKEALASLEKALPFLERAHKLDDKDVGTMTSLKGLYGQLGMTDKWNEMKQKMQ